MELIPFFYIILAVTTTLTILTIIVTKVANGKKSINTFEKKESIIESSIKNNSISNSKKGVTNTINNNLTELNNNQKVKNSSRIEILNNKSNYKSTKKYKWQLNSNNYASSNLSKRLDTPDNNIDEDKFYKPVTKKKRE